MPADQEKDWCDLCGQVFPVTALILEIEVKSCRPCCAARTQPKPPRPMAMMCSTCGRPDVAVWIDTQRRNLPTCKPCASVLLMMTPRDQQYSRFVDLQAYLLHPSQGAQAA